MPLADPLVVCRTVLLADPTVTALIGDRVYATPLLPKGHSYPCVRLTLTGASGHTPVGFRQGMDAAVQFDAWAVDMPGVSAVAEACLDSLHGTPDVTGAIRIKVVLEARELDEAVQPPLHRYRADLLVRVAKIA